MAQSAPPFTAYALPRERRPSSRGPAALLSLLLHGALALAVLWRGAALLQPGGGGRGALGGGGGGGRVQPAIRWFALPAPSAPQAHEVPAAPAVAVPPVAVPTPDPVPLELTRVAPPPTAVPAATAAAPAAPAAAAGETGGPGEGSGSGGGRGTGVGPGAGAQTGPDSGGQGEYFIAVPIGIIMPPQCARGTFRMQFWVEADGRVSRFDVTPLPKDVGCRRDLLDAMRSFRFRPARTRDGRPVASIVPVKVTQ